MTDDQEPRWPSGHTTEELEEAHLTDAERLKLAALIRMGISLAPHYRDRLRSRGLSWIGIPRAEQTPGRMARVLILLDRPERKTAEPYRLIAPCVESVGGRCVLNGEHSHIYTIRLL